MTQLIEWDKPELRVFPRKSNPNRRETAYKVTCSVCGYRRWLRKSDAKRCKSCRRCSSRKGFKASLSKISLSDALGHVREYRLANPSQPERIVAEWLDEWGLTYEREVVWIVDHSAGGGDCFGYVLDFVVSLPDSYRRAIEVNGYWHKRTRAQRDIMLVMNFPGVVWFVDGDLVTTNPDAARQQLAQFLQIETAKVD